MSNIIRRFPKIFRVIRSLRDLTNIAYHLLTTLQLLQMTIVYKYPYHCTYRPRYCFDLTLRKFAHIWVFKWFSKPVSLRKMFQFPLLISRFLMNKNSDAVPVPFIKLFGKNPRWEKALKIKILAGKFILTSTSGWLWERI